MKKKINYFLNRAAVATICIVGVLLAGTAWAYTGSVALLLLPACISFFVAAYVGSRVEQ